MNKPRSAPRRRVDGVLLLDKPLHLSSNDALQRARRLYNAAKAGHTGTLDPLATGLLPLCFGEATKFSGELLDADKTYLATVQLGVTTDTADAAGNILEVRPVDVTREQVQQALARFRGVIDQVPPMYSALKRAGKPLYEYARAGIEIERAARQVTIYDIKITAWQPQSFDLEVTCSKGTYVRTLAADIGEILGCGAHLAALRRTRIGELSVADAIGLDALDALDLAGRDARLSPTDTLVMKLPQVELSEVDTQRVIHGQGVAAAGAIGQRLRLVSCDGRFLGVGEIVSAGRLNPKRLVVP